MMPPQRGLARAMTLYEGSKPRRDSGMANSDTIVGTAFVLTGGCHR
jgi:hypothetical protein